jgi:asparagine synthase (glutamine-hydrolysing)
MCGICGIKSTEINSHELIMRMIDKLYHRGPDSHGFYKTDTYMAGMRRLSINGIHDGDQPLYNTNKDIILFYNGEIYNSPELRRMLEKEGFTFRTHSDGEVICHLYEIYGENLFEHLDGMFACALWSEREQKLILSRDLPGEKPLYYSILPHGGVAFASEVKSLLQIPQINKELDLQALWDFPTFLWIPEPDTAFREIKSIPRGHILIADEKGICIRPYANRFNPSLDIKNLSEADITELVRTTVSNAVYSRLLSDVPVGSFLSGGLDSTIVTTLASTKLGSLSTFTIGFEDLSDPYHGKADESAQAEESARRLGTKHHTIKVNANDFRSLLHEFCEKGDLPFSVSSGLGIMAVARSAREAGIKVLLTGDGADEAFGGYSWYPLLPITARKIPTLTAHPPVSYQNFGFPLAKRLDIMAGYDAPKRAWAWHYYAAEEEKIKLYSKDLFGGLQSSLRYFSEFKNSYWAPEDYIKNDQQFYFPFEMLRKADRMTMAFSVEGRIPFAAPAVQALASQLKFSHMIKGNTLKWILRKAFEDLLPQEIINRPKHGFNVPIDHWLKNEWSDLLKSAFAPSSALSRHGFLANGADQIAMNMRDDPIRLNGHTLFSYIMLDMWLEYLDTISMT